MLGRRDGRYLRIGHRGAAAVAPANSLEAIDAALAANLDGVEVDVVAVDGAIRVAHSLRERTAASPTLDDALERFVAPGAEDVLVHVDVKHPGFEEGVVGALRRHELLDRAVVSSSFHSTLRAVGRAEPTLAIGLAYPYDRTGLAERYLPDAVVRAGLGAVRRRLPRRIGGMMLGTGAGVAMLHHLVLSPAVMERCRRLGVAVWAWTVNDRTSLARVEALGVDAVLSDDPAVFVPAAE